MKLNMLRIITLIVLILAHVVLVSYDAPLLAAIGGSPPPATLRRYSSALSAARFCKCSSPNGMPRVFELR